jgi:hypothetical protein
MSKSFQIRDHFFPLLFPKNSEKKEEKKFEHWTLGSGGKNTFKRSEQMKKSVKNFFAAAILHHF